MTFWRRACDCAAAARFRFGGAAAARAADTVTIGTVGSASSNIWPVFIGQKKEFFAAENIALDVVYVQSSANLVQQLAAGSSTSPCRPGWSTRSARCRRRRRSRSFAWNCRRRPTR